MAKKKTNNGRAFGLCKKYGIELPKGATPPEAWDAFNEFRRSGLIPKDDDNESPEMGKGGLFDGAGSEDERKPFINVYLFGKPRDEKHLHINDVTEILNEANEESLEEAQKVFAEMVEKGQIDLSIRDGLQDKHIEGRYNRNQEIKKGRLPSLLTADPAELVKKHAGKGVLVFTKQGVWTQKENFSDSKIIGINLNKMFNISQQTKNGTIHYSNKGVHIVPGKKGEKEK